jgi:hypothetical protein
MTTQTLRPRFVLAGIAFFLSGVAVGQQSGADKFAKYLRPASMTAMDIGLFRAQLMAVKEMASSDYPIPTVTYDQRAKKFVLLRYVHALSQDSKQLSVTAQADYTIFIKPNFPDAVETDLVWEFFEANLGRTSVADYRNGVLVFR